MTLIYMMPTIYVHTNTGVGLGIGVNDIFVNMNSTVTTSDDRAVRHAMIR